MNDVIPLFTDDPEILLATCPECGYEVWYIEIDADGNALNIICGNDDPEEECDYRQDAMGINLFLYGNHEKEGEE